MGCKMHNILYNQPGGSPTNPEPTHKRTHNRSHNKISRQQNDWIMRLLHTLRNLKMHKIIMKNIDGQWFGSSLWSEIKMPSEIQPPLLFANFWDIQIRCKNSNLKAKFLDTIGYLSHNIQKWHNKHFIIQVKSYVNRGLLNTNKSFKEKDTW